MHWFAAIVYVTLVLLIGGMVTASLPPGRARTWAERTGLATALGSATLGFTLFAFSLLGVCPNRPLLLGLGVLAAAGLVARRRRRPAAGEERQPSAATPAGGWQWLAWCPLLVLLVVTHAAVFFHAFTFPLVEWDAFCIWGLKAKLLAVHSLTPVPAYFHDLTLSFSHLDYPLGLPFLTAGAYAAMGALDDQLGKALLPFLFLALSLLLYAEFRRRLGTGRALALLCVTAGTPSLVRWAGSGNADVPLALFYGGALLYLWRWIEDEDEADRAIAFLLAAFTTFVKNEGLPLGILCLAILAGVSWRRRRRLPPAQSTLVLALTFWGMAALWCWWSRDIPRCAENYGGRLRPDLLFANLGRLPLIVATLGAEALRIGSWGLLWLLLPLTAVLGWRGFQRPATLALWGVFAAHLALYVAAFVVTPWDSLPVLMAATLERILIPGVPAAALLIAAHGETIHPKR